MHNDGMAGDEHTSAGAESGLESGTARRNSVFAINPFLQENYGKIFDHLEPHVADYKKVFVLSEFELGVLSKIHKLSDLVLRTTEVEASLKRLFPDAADMISEMPTNERFELAVTLSAIGMFEQKSRERGPAAVSFLTGSEKDPHAFGVMYIPERATAVPEVLAGKVHGFQFAKPYQFPGQDDRIHDTTAFIISHEVGHLVHRMEMGEHGTHFGKESPNAYKITDPVYRLAGEIASDRFGLRMTKEMLEQGIIINPDINTQIADSRRVESFETMVKEGRMVSAIFGREPDAPQRAMNAVERHSTGFALDTDADPVQEHARLSVIASPLLRVRDETIKQLFGAAMTGSAPEPYQDAFFKALTQTKDSTQVGSAQDQFARDVQKMPELAKLVAGKVAEAEGVSPEAQQTAKMYLESLQRLDDQMTAAGTRYARPENTINTLMPKP